MLSQFAVGLSLSVSLYAQSVCGGFESACELVCSASLQWV